MAYLLVREAHSSASSALVRIPRPGLAPRSRDSGSDARTSGKTSASYRTGVPGEYLPAVTAPRESSALASAKDGEDSRGRHAPRRKDRLATCAGCLQEVTAANEADHKDCMATEVLCRKCGHVLGECKCK